MLAIDTPRKVSYQRARRLTLFAAFLAGRLVFLAAVFGFGLATLWAVSLSRTEPDNPAQEWKQHHNPQRQRNSPTASGWRHRRNAGMAANRIF
jgi:hypothetical protein